MRPAFSSTKQAAEFALLLLGILVLPVVMGKNLLPPRSVDYEFQGYGIAPLTWIHKQLFEETNCIDILFIGSSRLLCDIDTPYVQSQLSRQLRRNAIVRSVCWAGAGYDMLYLVSSDLLAHRKVGLIVFYDEDGAQWRNPLIPYIFRWCDDSKTVAGLPVRQKNLYYFAALEGMPRNLLALSRPEIPRGFFASKPTGLETLYESPDPAQRMGSVSAGRGFNPDTDAHSEFVEFAPPSVAITNFFSYEPITRNYWKFSKQNLPAWQAVFAQKFVSLAKLHGCHLAMIHLPTVSEISSPIITERACWPDFFRTDIKLIGLPSAQLFIGFQPSEALKLYFDVNHFNRNGQKFFTPLITPTLLMLYENTTNN